ncbi:hypothetical protein CROQUDRAFT_102196 [Cronartium quercuum f. sp. fusiforme G11]|uniref:Uncharacterized protein n=1 Tax=Cronartium quercuum f. sp. fusiforme G11 TaxID=708437 RepID=A0A9P6N8A5_9BASI|nr:hypothetical protein CROQUDRAFT_102196 [Cronartium quercuum f. sp. fusiforme G11]
MFKVVLELINRRGSMTPVDSPKIQPTVISIHVSHNKVVKTEAKYTVKKPKDLLELLKEISSKEGSVEEWLKNLLSHKALMNFFSSSSLLKNKWQSAVEIFNFLAPKHHTTSIENKAGNAALASSSLPLPVNAGKACAIDSATGWLWSGMRLGRTSRQDLPSNFEGRACRLKSRKHIRPLKGGRHMRQPAAEVPVRYREYLLTGR